MKQSNGVQAAWAVVGLLAGGCTVLLGGDEDYHLGCTPGAIQCGGNTPRRCVDGVWQNQTACSGQTCIGGVCAGECEPDGVQCDGNTPQRCVDGVWQDQTECSEQTCVGGACTGECASAQMKCRGSMVQSCGMDGHWQDDAPCPLSAPVCSGGSCLNPPSCDGLPPTSGPAGNESCCASTVVPGGTYNRSNDPLYPATVSDFGLDRFEITVGRFRAFVAAYPGSKPAPGAGAHPLIADSGWDPAWDVNLPLDHPALVAAVKCDSTYQTWVDMAPTNENLPMNCITWYEAFAFCAWDGGRLPTEAEWNYAAAGGAEQRQYPWSTPPTSMMVDPSYAVYDCSGDGSAAGDCASGDILTVGSKAPKGDGKWLQADLGGSMWEWNVDWSGDYAPICHDCANLISGSFRVIRGGSWYKTAPNMLSSVHGSNTPTDRFNRHGARCARSP